MNIYNKLCPDAILIEDVLIERGESTYTIIKWNEDKLGPLPTEQVLLDLFNEATIYYSEYAINRRREYPPITDYLDGIVKGDQAQVQAYIDACLAVKAQYPKPL
jgi:hypothetical protein